MRSTVMKSFLSTLGIILGFVGYFYLMESGRMHYDSERRQTLQGLPFSKAREHLTSWKMHCKDISESEKLCQNLGTKRWRLTLDQHQVIISVVEELI